MAGFDKFILMEKLIAAGWQEAPATVECDSLSHYCLVPPESLWVNRPASFYVYDAKALQNLLAPATEGENVVTDEPEN